ncbi:MAG TPA: ScyD/ScyE family protein [Thermomicrobiales bacterium]|nr:ScyD/ScyE family protein [Thermomicrobiales bacterium]
MSLTDRKMNRRVVVATAVAGAGIAVARPAFAQDATPAASPVASPVASPAATPVAGGGLPPLPEGAVVVAQGLWNPGDIALGDDGTLYIAETGVAGGGDSTSEPAAATPNAEGTPPAGAPPLIPPQISKVAPDGTQSVLTTEAGGIGIGLGAGVVYVSTGGGSVGSGFTPLPQENTVSAVDSTTGEVTLLASLGPYEVANNPDGLDVNPNLYGLAVDASGLLYVADAGGNTIYTVDPTTKTFALFAVVPNLTDLTGATPTAEEQAQQAGPRQPVPTSVVIDAGGNINVVLLGEMWSGPSVLSYAPDGTYSVGISGLSMIVAATIGPDGLLYVSQLSADFTSAQPAPGAVIRIKADGTTENAVEGLFFPSGITFDADGNLYVATNSIISGPDAPLGQVARIDGVATPA